MVFLLTACLYDQAHYQKLLAHFNDEDGDQHPGYEDCNDANSDVFPGQDERCDGVDNDCDGEVDEEALDTHRWYQDLDQDGYGGTEVSRESCISPSGYSENGGDCNDEDTTVFPGALESCEESIDRNCDGNPGNLDADGDGAPACVDCNDGDPAIFPDQPEVCDFVDQNCDGLIDNDAQDARNWYLDADGDGFGVDETGTFACYAPTGEYVTANHDCDDRDASIHPGATEICGDEIDNNCSGTPDGCRPEGDWNPQTTLGNGASDNLRTLVGLGDVDADGAGDLLVGSDTYDYGMVALLTGPFSAGDLDIQTEAEMVVYGSVGDAYLGSRATGAYDFDGDGLLEVVFRSQDSKTFLGSLHLMSVSKRGTATVGEAALFTLASVTEDTYTLGDFLGAHTDVDGDGADELLVASSGALYNQVEDSGRIYRLSGGFLQATSVETLARLRIEGAEGEALASVVMQDVNGDGVEDYQVGALYNDEGGADAGMIYTLYGPLSGIVQTAQADVSQRGAAGDYLGLPLVGAGDVDGDGRLDLWAPVAYSSFFASEAGAAYLLPATASSGDVQNNALAILHGESSGDLFGVDLAALDVDEDGKEDVWVGAIHQAQGGTDAGKAYLFYGPFTGTISGRDADATSVGSASYANAGYCVAAVGDLNADGHPDLGFCESSGSPSTLSHISLLYGYAD